MDGIAPTLVVSHILKSTLISRIVVQDILIIFRHFSSQDTLLKGRTVINFQIFPNMRRIDAGKRQNKRRMLENMKLQH